MFLFISFFSNYLAYNAYTLYYIDANSNFSYSSISFLISNESKGKASVSKELLCTEKIMNKASLYKVYSDCSTSTYGVICSRNNLNIISGQDFTYDDLNNNTENLAIIGTNTSEICDIENITINNSLYHVKGIFEDRKKPSNNYTIYINETSDEILCDDLFIIDGDSKSDIKEMYNIINKSLTENGYTAKIINNDKVSPSNFINYQLPIVIVYIFTFFIMIFLNSVISFFWLFSNQREIAILKLVGKGFVTKILIRYTICSAIANALGTLISFFIFKDSQFFYISIVTVFLVEILELISITFGMIYFYNKDTNYLMEIDYE